MYYLLLRDLDERTSFIGHMKRLGIQCAFHYVPLHSSPKGRQIGRTVAELPVTTNVADRLVRLPLWVGIEEHLDRIVETTFQFFGQHA
jgi:dTDP-4-amino-4,6-dideoxygalactose transaminase